MSRASSTPQGARSRGPSRSRPSGRRASSPRRLRSRWANASTSAAVTRDARMPAAVDAAWWRRHAHLVRERGEHGCLRFDGGDARSTPRRPTSEPPAPMETAFAGLVGQDERVARLTRAAQGARARGKRFPHVLLTGPAGTGKSTLARGIAVAAGRPIAQVSAPLVTDRVTWVRLLAGLAEGSVLFLDEAHALPRAAARGVARSHGGASALARALRRGDGRAAHRAANCPSFTLVAATTDEGAIPPALRSRFGLRETLVHYEADALTAVVREAAARAGAEATPEGARRLAEAARGTPREALRLLDRALDDAAAGGRIAARRRLRRAGALAAGLRRRRARSRASSATWRC